MFKSFISGNLTADPVVSDIGCTNFTVAANTVLVIDGKPKTEFVRVAVWGKPGESAAKYLKKGDPVTVVGDYTESEYVDTHGEKQKSINLRNCSFDFVRSGTSRNAAPAANDDDDDDESTDIFDN